MRTRATNRVGKRSLQNCQILKNLLEISRFSSPISRFPSPKIRFSSHKIRFSPIGFLLSSTAFQLSSTAFRFLQRLSAFFNGFPTFFNGFPIFRNGFLLSKKSEKIYLRRQVYKRSLFELCISRHSLPKLRNSRYIVYISPTLLWCTCVPNSAPNLKSKLKYNLSRIQSNCSHQQIPKFDKCLTL